MRAALLLAAAVAAAGCASNGEPPAAGPTAGLGDAVGDAEPRFDLVRADLVELNGSLALRLEVRNYADGFPLVDARLETTRGTAYARVVPAPEKRTSPQLKAEAGRVVDGARTDAQEACWLPSFPSHPDSAGPWWIVLELLHNRTGLAAGGEVSRLTVVTTDLDEAEKDLLEGDLGFGVRGGENPYAEETPACPLHHERQRVTDG